MSGRKRALSASSWSDLPREIISKIETRLDSAVDMLHLRSVCKNWRSSRNPNSTSILSPLLPLIIPNAHLPFSDRPRAPVTLIARAVFLVKPLESSSDSCGWLLTVEETVPGKLRILYPLSNNDVRHHLPSDFPKYLDLSKFRVSQVAKSYGFKYESDGADVVSVRRVVLCSGITAMVLFGGGTLIGLRLKTGNWSYVRRSITCLFKDVISCGGDNVRAVDYKGHVHTIDHRVTKVVKSVKVFSLNAKIHGPDKINLIRSNGELFAATCSDDSLTDNFDFEIYRLDEVQYEWVDDVKRDYCSKVLFVSSDWSFFLFTHDLDLRHYSPIPNRTEQKDTMSGDYVIYSERSFNNYSAWSKTSQLYKGASLNFRIGVYFCNIDDLSFWQRAHCCSNTTNVLWPPPTWFWPDTCLSTRDDEELDIHSQSSSLYSRKEQLPSFTANASTRTIVAYKEVITDEKVIAANRMHWTPSISSAAQRSSTVKFQGVEIRFELLPTLQTIWAKYGNLIGENAIRSKKMLGCALEELAELKITLNNTTGRTLTESETDDMRSSLSDLKYAGLKVDWLEPFIEHAIAVQKSKEIIESIEGLKKRKARVEENERKFLAGTAKVKQELEESEACLRTRIPFPEDQIIDLDDCLGAGI